MTFVAFKDVVLFVLAVYAACLSTFNLWKSLKKDQRSLKVTLATVVPTYGPDTGPPFVKITATNAGHRTVVVSLLTLRLPDGNRLFPMHRDQFPGIPDARLPAALGEGDAASIYIPYADVGGALLGHGKLRKTLLTPVCEDSIGGSYEGTPWEVNPHEWSRMQ
jgi:hypothetical protein